MELSTEDNLRLNVLLHQALLAVRIDESAMVLHALTEKGEAKISLNPTCRDEKYLRLIRELLSTHVLGTPGGYPVFLKRWTRMGQMRDGSLEGLLLLGEPEAVIAVAHAPGLTVETARRAWWAMPGADVARRMLENPLVAQSTVGRELALYLWEFLPFESEPQAMIDSVRLILQPGLIDPAERLSLWKKAARKTAFYAGFLSAEPDNLPEPRVAHPNYVSYQELFRDSPLRDHWLAQQLLRLHSGAGQTFLGTLLESLEKMAHQDVAIALFSAIERYFAGSGQKLCVPTSDGSLMEAAINSFLASDAFLAIRERFTQDSQLQAALRSTCYLTQVSVDWLDPIFAQTDATGSVMRKKLTPLLEPLVGAIVGLQWLNASE